MANRRIIARLDVKMDFLIKGIHLEGWRKIGKPEEWASRYYQRGIDELIFMDVVASLYERNNLFHIVEDVARHVFIPITVGGGLRSLDDVRETLASGADKVAINTAATRDPDLIRRVSETYGSQATVLSIEAKRWSQRDGWEALTDNGRNHTGRDVVEWAEEAAALGAGEILLTSVDRDGTGRGYDLELVEAVSAAVPIPVVASGGLGTAEHAIEAFTKANADAIAIAKALHYDQIEIGDLRRAMLQEGVETRDPVAEGAVSS